MVSGRLPKTRIGSKGVASWPMRLWRFYLGCGEAGGEKESPLERGQVGSWGDDWGVGAARRQMRSSTGRLDLAHVRKGRPASVPSVTLQPSGSKSLQSLLPVHVWTIQKQTSVEDSPMRIPSSPVQCAISSQPRWSQRAGLEWGLWQKQGGPCRSPELRVWRGGSTVLYDCC